MPQVSQSDQSGGPSQRQTRKRGKKRGNTTEEKTRSVLKVKTSKHRNTGTKSDKKPGRWMVEPAAAKGAGPDSVGGDVFSFSQRPISKDKQEKEKEKLAVLKTISKLLKENQIIRRRLATLRQTNLKVLTD